jgi:hypothetical protein
VEQQKYQTELRHVAHHVRQVTLKKSGGISKTKQQAVSLLSAAWNEAFMLQLQLYKWQLGS